MKDYIEQAKRTDIPDYEVPRERLNSSTVRLLHGSMGLVTEAGEFEDALKKHLFYGRPLDRVNLVEEISDVLWYTALLCDELGVSFEEVMKINIDKLRSRYPEKFTENHAINRDTVKERAILEGNATP